jgi:peptidylprolyl isomerase
MRWISTRRPRACLSAGLAFTALAAAACGSSSTSSTQSATGASATTAAPAPTSLVGPPAPTTAATPGTAGGASAPPVANDTDLKSAPVPSAGTAPPPTTLIVKDLVVGTGQQAAAGQTVQVQYVGANYADGKAFDSSWQRGQPATFSLSGVVPGFAQGIVGMKIGGRRELVLPPDLGYGASGSPPAVGPNETLIFVVDLLGIQ